MVARGVKQGQNKIPQHKAYSPPPKLVGPVPRVAVAARYQGHGFERDRVQAVQPRGNWLGRSDAWAMPGQPPRGMPPGMPPGGVPGCGIPASHWCQWPTMPAAALPDAPESPELGFGTPAGAAAISRSHLAAGLPLEPEQIFVVNSTSSGACASLAMDAGRADLVGFDAEWAPDYDIGSDNPIAVLQLAFPISRRVYVLQLSQLGRLPTEVQMLFVNSDVLKVGFAVDRNDRAKFQRSNIAIGAVCDVQGMCEASVGSAGYAMRPGTMGLGYAAQVILGQPTHKDHRTTCSDWTREVLSTDQVYYAAMDAWVALRLYGAVSKTWGQSASTTMAPMPVERASSQEHAPQQQLLAPHWQASVNRQLSAGFSPRAEIANALLVLKAVAAEPELPRSSSSRSTSTVGSTTTGGSTTVEKKDSCLRGALEQVLQNVEKESAIPTAEPEKRDGRGQRAHLASCHVDAKQDKSSCYRPFSIASTLEVVWAALGFMDVFAPGGQTRAEWSILFEWWGQPAFVLVLVLALFLLFPPGAPCVILLPLHMVLLQILKSFEFLPTHASSLMPAYTIGCNIRLAAGVCAVCLRVWIAGDDASSVGW